MSKNERKCENCYYVRPAVRDDLLYCSYLGDTIGSGEDISLDEHVVNSIKFKGFVFEGFVEIAGEPVLKPCVTPDSRCKKFSTQKGN
jgi:hypothetical protein